MKISLLGTLMSLLIVFTALGQNSNRWRIDPDGSIVWDVGKDIPHYDHVEMSGEFLSSVMRYGVNDDGSFSLERTVIWPMLRTIPNDTHGSLTKRFSVDFMQLLVANNSSLKSENSKVDAI